MMVKEEVNRVSRLLDGALFCSIKADNDLRAFECNGVVGLGGARMQLAMIQAEISAAFEELPRKSLENITGNG